MSSSLKPAATTRACLAATGDQLLVEIEGDRDPLIRADAPVPQFGCDLAGGGFDYFLT